MEHDDGELSFEALTFEETKEKFATPPPTPPATPPPAQLQAQQQPPPQQQAQQRSAEEIDSSNALVVYTDYGVLLDFGAVTEICSNIGCAIKQWYYRAGQSFGFVCFQEQHSLHRAMMALRMAQLPGGVTLQVELSHKVTPGKDPRTHDQQSEFRSAVLVVKNLPFQLKIEKLEEMLAQYEERPQNVSYLYDSTGDNDQRCVVIKKPGSSDSLGGSGTHSPASSTGRELLMAHIAATSNTSSSSTAAHDGTPSSYPPASPSRDLRKTSSAENAAAPKQQQSAQQMMKGKPVGRARSFEGQSPTGAAGGGRNAVAPSTSPGSGRQQQQQQQQRRSVTPTHGSTTSPGSGRPPSSSNAASADRTSPAPSTSPRSAAGMLQHAPPLSFKRSTSPIPHAMHSGVSLLRQPRGPDGSAGFSTEYRQSRAASKASMLSASDSH